MFTSTKLKQVVGIDRAGSVSAAARNLNVSQSTLTKAMADVEDDLGFAIFFRTAKGVVATPEGREFLSRAERIVADFEMLVDDARASKTEGEMNLRIGIAPASQEGLYNRVITKLLQDWPEITLSVAGLTVERGVRALKRGDLDLLFSMMPELKRESDFVTQTISHIEVALFCRKGHPLIAEKCNASEIRSRLKEFKMISPDLNSEYPRKIAELLKYTNEEARRQMHVIENFSLAADAVAKTDLIGFVGSTYASSRSFQERFAVLDVDVFDALEIGAARLSRWLPSKAVRACLSVLERMPPDHEH